MKKLILTMCSFISIVFTYQSYAFYHIESYLPLSVENKTDISFTIKGSLYSPDLPVKAIFPANIEANSLTYPKAQKVVFSGPSDVEDLKFFMEVKLDFTGKDAETGETILCSITVYPKFDVNRTDFSFWPIDTLYGGVTKGGCNRDYSIRAVNYTLPDDKSWIIINKNLSA